MSYGMSLFTFASTLLLVHGHAAAFVPLTTHDGTPLRWVERQLTFHVATAEPEEVDLAAVPVLVTTLFSRWSSATCGHIPEVIFGGLIDTDAATSPAISAPDNLILFVRSREAWLALGQSPDTLAAIMPTFHRLSGELIDVDILVNDAFHTFTLSPAPAPGEFDLGVVLLHEIGHFYGLDHSEDERAVMHHEHASSRDTLSADDLAGICAIYADTQTPGGVAPEGPCCGSAATAHGLAAALLFLGSLASRRRRADPPQARPASPLPRNRRP